jgi:hypothetical protein
VELVGGKVSRPIGEIRSDFSGPVVRVELGWPGWWLVVLTPPPPLKKGGVGGGGEDVGTPNENWQMSSSQAVGDDHGPDRRQAEAPLTITAAESECALHKNIGGWNGKRGYLGH